MSTTDTDRYSDPGMTTPARQGLMGAALLVVGCLVFAGLVVAGANVVSGVGLVLAVWGIALLVNALGQARKDRGEGREQIQQDTGSSARGVLALVLAFVVPPVGLLLAAYSPSRQGLGGRLQGLAIPVGAILTVLYTFGIVLTAALGRSPN